MVRARPNSDISAAFAGGRYQALQNLVAHHDSAREKHLISWEFACSLEALRAAGVTPDALRWLLAHGYLRHRPEPRRGRRGKAGEPKKRSRNGFGPHSRFLLTPSGFGLARICATHVLQGPHDRGKALNAKRARNQRPAIRPRWDPERGILWFGDDVVKEFRVPAGNQQLILAAFQEEDWPVHLDDPLRPAPHINPQRRLHNTISRLNGCQGAARIRFHGDGTGCGIRWAILDRNQIATRSQPDRR